MPENSHAFENTMLVKTLEALNGFDPDIDLADEEMGVFLADNIGGPQGDLPFTAASFAISPSAARLLNGLADALQAVGAQFNITVQPNDLGIFWDVSDAPDVADTGIRWTDPNTVNPAALRGTLSKDVSNCEIHITRYGEVWFHVDTDGPGTADAPINRAILREIAEGPSSGPAPGA